MQLMVRREQMGFPDDPFRVASVQIGPLWMRLLRGPFGTKIAIVIPRLSINIKPS